MTPNPTLSARALPAVHVLLRTPVAEDLVRQHGHTAVVAALRGTLDRLRHALLNPNRPADVSLDPGDIIEAVKATLAGQQTRRLRRTINATGIVLHTGLGRAPMSDAVREALAELTRCCNVQMDLTSGGRIRREDNVRDLVKELTGAEETLVVNNNAGATLLVLRALAQGREVVVSRGELIEIGGSFRLPEIMAESGAVLREVGSTNKTHARDYEKAINPNTALLLKAHKSNYQIVGFTKEVGIAEIATIGKQDAVPVVDDLGCGALVPLETYGLSHEMTMRESLEAGADIVLSSTDKLIGGPQGGLIIGRKDLLDRVRSQPLYRALRVGKMTLAALEATLRLFKTPERLPNRSLTYAMIARTAGELEKQAHELAALLSEKRPDWDISVVRDVSYLGGGSLPGDELPASAVRLCAPPLSADDLARQLRQAPVPVVARVKDDAVLLNLRTILPDEVVDVVSAVTRVAEAR